jgi:hypothetical protein
MMTTTSDASWSYDASVQGAVSVGPRLSLTVEGSCVCQESMVSSA